MFKYIFMATIRVSVHFLILTLMASYRFLVYDYQAYDTRIVEMNFLLMLESSAKGGAIHPRSEITSQEAKSKFSFYPQTL